MRSAVICLTTGLLLRTAWPIARLLYTRGRGLPLQVDAAVDAELGTVVDDGWAPAYGLNIAIRNYCGLSTCGSVDDRKSDKSVLSSLCRLEEHAGGFWLPETGSSASRATLARPRWQSPSVQKHEPSGRFVPSSAGVDSEQECLHEVVTFFSLFFRKRCRVRCGVDDTLKSRIRITRLSLIHVES